VLQLHVLSIGTRAQGWIDRQRDADRFAWRTRAKGDVVILEGDYPTLGAARAAAAQITEEGLGKPWVRRVRAVLAELADPKDA
jgi:Uncharacterized protein conserved in bacteria